MNTPEIDTNPAANPPIAHAIATSATSVLFQINSTKLYVPVVTLYINHSIKFLGNLKQGFKRTISWNKYRSEIATQPKNNHLDYMIDSTLTICSIVQSYRK